MLVVDPWFLELGLDERKNEPSWQPYGLANGRRKTVSALSKAASTYQCHVGWSVNRVYWVDSDFESERPPGGPSSLGQPEVHH